jgi:hypothetical protein
MEINEYIIETIEGSARLWYLCMEYGQLVQTSAPDIVAGELIVCPCGTIHEWRSVPEQYQRLGSEL